ncbi:MAG: bifunctional phosphoribosylaminoimidazolecarboxamide formyltransferase/IMP cyclohydrolase, partial [Vicinamibacterales bacterium]
VSDKTGIVDLGRGLAARGFELVSTGGTARALTEAGLAVTGVYTLTGFTEMMDGRVKTLHPALHGGILARRDRPDDLAALEAHGLGLIDVVVVNLYPFARAAANPDTPFDHLVEEIDIGGPSLVRAAAKNFQGVLVVVEPADYTRLLQEIDKKPSLAFRFDLMRKAIAHTAAYDTTIAATLATISIEDGRFQRPAAGQTPTSALDLRLEKVRDLRYGENPHQKAAWLRPVSGHSGGFSAADVLQGKELSYTNLLDLDAAARIALEFEEPAAVVIKHTNPCGVATGTDAADAYVRARDADALAAFGGIVALNRTLDRSTAEAIVSTFIEAVIVPAVDPAAREILARKANMRIVVADFRRFAESAADASAGNELRSILGAVLTQQRDRVVEARHPWPGDMEGLKVVTKRQPTAEEWEALRFAWRVCAHVKSNTVLFTDHRRSLAIGAGQMSRVDAVNVAVMKAKSAGVSLTGSAAASDAFFPFRDGLDSVASAGARAVVQPGGSVRDAEVIAAADEQDLAMVFTGRRHFRH